MQQDFEAGEGPRVAGLYRYPVKGFSAEPLQQVVLEPGQTFPGDRRFAIENGGARFDAAAPKHLPKSMFLTLMRNERLATLRTQFVDATETWVIERDGRPVAQGQITSRIGLQLIEQFLAAYLEDELRGPPRIVEAPGHSFSDVAAKCVHIINLSSVRALERSAGRSIDPKRFRANIIVDGLPPWAELGWVGKSLRAGSCLLDVWDLTGRCAATDVDPETGGRDIAVPALLQRTLGHTSFGVYAKVASGGVISAGDMVALSA